MNPSSSLRLPKRPRLLPPRKVCFVAHFRQYSEGDRSDEYRLFIMDPESPPNGPIVGGLYRIDPTIRLTASSRALAFCAVDYMLYVFEGVRGRGSAPTEGSASKLELSAQLLTGSNCKLAKDELDMICGMHHTKNLPVALPTPNGKTILVFSLLIYAESAAAFELYNIADNTWKVLPNPFHRKTLAVGAIDAYGFVGECRFLVQMKQGIFVLDFEAEKWTKLCQYGGAHKIPWNSHFVGIEDGGFCITPGIAYDIRDNDGFTFSRSHRFPLPSYPPREIPDSDEFFHHGFSQGITLLEYQNGVCDVCTLHGEDYVTGDGRVCLHMNVFSADIGKYKMDKELEDKKEARDCSAVPLNTAVIKSVDLLIDVDLHASISCSLSLFSL